MQFFDGAVKIVGRCIPVRIRPLLQTTITGFLRFCLCLFGITLFVFLCMALPPSWQPLPIITTFITSFFTLNYTPPLQRRHRKTRRRRLREKKWRRCQLHYSLIIRCRRRKGQRPPRLDGRLFPSPHCSKYRRWRRRKKQAKYRLWRRRVVLHEFFLTPKKDPSFSLPTPISDELLNAFCYGTKDFLQLPKLLSSLSVEHDHFNSAQQTLNRLHLMQAALEACANNESSRAFLYMMLAWDTGASFGLHLKRFDDCVR